MKKSHVAYVAIFLAFFTITSSFGQSFRLRRADKLYNLLAYKAAAEAYEGLVSSKSDTSAHTLRNLASCYYNMGDMAKACEQFARFASGPDAVANDYLLYSQALKQSNRAEESGQWLQRFEAASAADSRAQEYKADQQYLSRLNNRVARYELTNLKINGKTADFGGYSNPVTSKVYFLSARKTQLSVDLKWAWDGSQFLNLYAANRADSGQLKNVALLGRDANGIYHEGPLVFTSDGKKVFFTRNNDLSGRKKRDKKGIQNLVIYQADIDSAGKWHNEKMLPFCSSEYSVGHPTISRDGQTLYFASDMPGSKGVDIYQASINSDGSLGTPQLLAGAVNTEGDELFPWIGGKGELYFSSNGHLGLGGLDVFVFEKSGKVSNLGKPVNSNRDDFAFLPDNDGKFGFVSSNREGGKGEDDIYSFVKVGPPMTMLSGVVTDLNDGKPVPGATVTVRDASGQVFATVTADQNGYYEVPVEINAKYQVLATKEKYLPGSPKEVLTTEAPAKVDLALQGDWLKLQFVISDKKTKERLSDVSIALEDLVLHKTMSYKTDSVGQTTDDWSSYKIGDTIRAKVTLDKAGYMSKDLNLVLVVNKRGLIEVAEYLDLNLSKIEIGADLNEMIAINPIYFDLGKWNIRPDAAIELDKIVSVMKKYPTLVIELGSHTDCRASMAFNMTLSSKRAVSSAEYIKSRIPNPERIYGVGYGETRLKVDCPCEGKVKSSCSEEEHQKNRRTEFIIKKI